MENLDQLKEALYSRVEVDDDKPRLTRKVYEDTLPEDMTMAQVKRMERHNALYRAAGNSVLSETSLGILVDNPNKEYVDFEVEFGSQSVLRNRVHRNLRLGKGDKARDQFGHSTPVVNHGNEPELLESIESISKRGLELFGPK